MMFRHLWSSAPSETLLKTGLATDDPLTRDKLRKTISICAQNQAMAEDSLTEAELSDIVFRAYDVYESSPTFVCHGDPHVGNILIRKDDFFIIDWDKWKIEKVGAGAIYTDDLEAAAVNAFLKESIPSVEDGKAQQFRSNFILFNLVEATEKREYGKAALFLRMLQQAS